MLEARLQEQAPAGERAHTEAEDPPVGGPSPPSWAWTDPSVEGLETEKGVSRRVGPLPQGSRDFRRRDLAHAKAERSSASSGPNPQGGPGTVWEFCPVLLRVAHRVALTPLRFKGRLILQWAR